MEISFQAYFKHLDQLGGTLEELTGLAREKTRAVMKGDLEAVDAVVRREQALSLSLRGAERRREEFMKGLGLQGTALSALPDRVPEELRPQARKTVEELRRRYELYRDTAQVARTTLECNIHMIEKHMEQISGAPAPSGSVTDIRA